MNNNGLLEPKNNPLCVVITMKSPEEYDLFTAPPAFVEKKI